MGTAVSNEGWCSRQTHRVFASAGLSTIPPPESSLADVRRVRWSPQDSQYIARSGITLVITPSQEYFRIIQEDQRKDKSLSACGKIGPARLTVVRSGLLATALQQKLDNPREKGKKSGASRPDLTTVRR